MPLLAEQSKLRFLPHTVPSWAAQTNMRIQLEGLPSYSYKRVSVRVTSTDKVERPEVPAASGTETSIWRQRMIDRIAEEYAEHIGPIPGIAVRNAARHCNDPYQLYELLAEEIADADSRAAFLSNAPRHGSVLLRRGDHFGAAAYTSGRPQPPADMHALDEVELDEFDRQSLLQAKTDDPEGAAEFCRRLTVTGADTSTDADGVDFALAITR